MSGFEKSQVKKKMMMMMRRRRRKTTTITRETMTKAE